MGEEGSRKQSFAEVPGLLRTGFAAGLDSGPQPRVGPTHWDGAGREVGKHNILEPGAEHQPLQAHLKGQSPTDSSTFLDVASQRSDREAKCRACRHSMHRLEAFPEAF